MDDSKRNKVLYWTFTLLFALPMLASGVAYFSGVEQIAQGISQLGYPLYILKILGTAKILGGAAILFNRFATLKEWAYAGFTFDLVGAMSSHLFAGDPIQNVIAPLIFLSLMIGSYVFWKKLPRTSNP